MEVVAGGPVSGTESGSMSDGDVQSESETGNKTGNKTETSSVVGTLSEMTPKSTTSTRNTSGTSKSKILSGRNKTSSETTLANGSESGHEFPLQPSSSLLARLQ
jgi:hypothetical protein